MACEGAKANQAVAAIDNTILRRFLRTVMPALVAGIHVFEIYAR
jgi:hypothetical protein